MLNFINLVRNENMKLYFKTSNKVMIASLIALIVGLGLFFWFQGDDAYKENGGSSWQSALKAENGKYQKQLKGKEQQLPQYTIDYYQKQIALNNYRLENNIPPEQSDSIWGFMKDTATFVMLITLFTIVVGAGMVANEFSWGTIKLLLIRPVRRSKILLAKYVTTLLFAIGMLILLFAVSFLTGGLLFGFEDVGQPYLAYSEGKVVETSQVYNILSTYAFNSVMLIMMVTFAFMMSTIFRTSSLAIGLSMFLMFLGSNIVAVLASFGYTWPKYLLFANLDLKVYYDGIPPVEGMTLGFSVTVLFAYFIIFNFLSWYIFNKRDVAA